MGLSHRSPSPHNTTVEDFEGFNQSK